MNAAALLHRAPRVAKRYLEGKATFIGSTTGVHGAGGRVVLTYDDGPEPDGTDAVLPVLAAHGVHATFFVLLTRVRRYRSLLAEVLDAGHEVALHGIDHRPLTMFSAREVQRRTADGRAELEDATGRPVRWVRPPYGYQTLSTWRAIRATGLTPVMWSATTSDSQHVSPAERIAKAMSGAVDGSILLSHDGFAGPEDGVDDGPRPIVDRGELTGSVLDHLDAAGLTGASLSEVLALGRPVRRAWFQK